MQEAILCDALEFDACTDPICFKWQELEIPEDVAFVMPATCQEMLARRLRTEIDGQVQDLIETRAAEYYTGYRQACLDPNLIDDDLEITQARSIYRFTLYYYDRTGHLVRTVPPAGVELIPADAFGNRDRNTHPNHTLVTTYEYNALGQLVAKESPDGGRATFVYDDVSRIRLSQDARQLTSNTYSYSRYDDLSRVVEVGQCDEPAYSDEDGDTDVDEIDLRLGLTGAANDALFPKPVHNPEQRTYTEYTSIAPSTAPAYSGEYIDGTPQRYMLNRVAHVHTDDGVHTQYSYDPHGNVEWVQQDLPGLGVNWARYEYDLISGNILKLHYNEGWEDGFKHAWRYDDDNRLIEVRTSREGVIWEGDARYHYYLHGPQNRVEYGEDSVQGRDYVYTLQGWLKGINHPALNASETTPNFDPGLDGELAGPHKGSAYDAFGMILEYYKGDFSRLTSGGSMSGFNSTGQIGPPQSGQVNKWHLHTTNNLYNGNIASWTSNHQKVDDPLHTLQYDGTVTGHIYKYDVLNRLLQADFKRHTGSGYGETTTTDQYNEAFSYDPNGNIKTLARFGPNGSMDQLAYEYYPGEARNRLRRVRDAMSVSATYTMDIDDQNHGVVGPNHPLNNYYTYDEIGNLIVDKQEGTEIEWSLYGKVLHVAKNNGEDLLYTYDALGNRVIKEVLSTTGTKKTYYVYEAGGKLLAIYDEVCENVEPPAGPDYDRDGIPDGSDNCWNVFNPDQTDLNGPLPGTGNGIGEACENDWDGDGVANNVDNCPYQNDPTNTCDL